MHHSFEEFYEKVVMPMKKANPSWIRLDGRTNGSNIHIAGKFKYTGKIWEVHADTLIKPLDCAYTSIRKGHNPFKQILTRKAKRLCLVLVKSLWPIDPKYLYIYETSP